MLPVSSRGRNRGRISFVKFSLISTTSLFACMLFSEVPATAEQATPNPDVQTRPVDVSAPRARPRQTTRPSAPAR
jgi:hypothetical protein